MLRTFTKILLKLCSLLALLLFVLTALIIIAFWNFDLDDFTGTLAAKMGAALHQPVSIGSSKLTFHGGIAIELQQITIGSDDSFRASAPKTVVTLAIAPLLRGNLILKELRMVEPRLELTLKSGASLPQSGSEQLMNVLGINTLSIYNASLRIRREGAAPPWDNLNLEQFNAVLRGRQSAIPGQLTVVGALPAHTANFSLTTNLPTLTSSSDWIQEQFNGRLKLTHFSLEQAPELSGDKLMPRAFDLEFNFAGIPAQGIPVTLKLSAASAKAPLAAISALWTANKATQDIDAIEGEFFSIPVNGELHLSSDEISNHLSGRFAASALDLNSPELKFWQLPILKEFTGGRLNHLQASFAKNWKRAEPFGDLPPLELSLNLEDLQWGDSALKRLPQLSAELLFNKDELKIRKGHLIAPTGDNFNLAGSVDSPLNNPKIAIAADGRLALEPLRQLLQPPSDWSMNGSVPLQVTLRGTAQDTQLTLAAELSGAGIGYNNLLQKTQGQPATLTLKAQHLYNKIDIEQILLKLKDQNLSAHGTFDLADISSSLTLSLNPVDIEKLGQHSPLLKKHQTKGSIKARLTPSASGPVGQITLDNGGAHLTRVIGELNRVAGTARLTRKGMEFTHIKASLGESQFTLDGDIANWQQPQLRLNLSADRVRARDLFFRDETLNLYGLSGRLMIDGQGILFTPIRLRLEEDTLIAVTGELKDFKNPQILLDVQGGTANIMNVIDLFTGPPKFPQGEQHKSPSVRITTYIKTGILGDLRFKNAEATVSFANGQLDISPLSFENGQGRCDGRVIFDKSDAFAPLKVSGHIEDIDAQVIHRDFFKKPGLISGNLRGDFYLEGNPKNGFWKQARGGIALQVRDGVLNKFSALSKVFSLLNVSQLLSFKLPDLQTEGMPFSLLEGSMRITEGSMHTHDLKITSEAMNLSLIGSQGLTDDTLDFTLGVMPLRTVDKVISSIPIAGWLLAGEDKALVTAYFKIEGKSQNPQVSAIPIGSLSESIFGIFKRTLKLPGKLLKDIGSALSSQPE
jgi:hypothetical protein